MFQSALCYKRDIASSSHRILGINFHFYLILLNFILNSTPPDEIYIHIQAVKKVHDMMLCVSWKMAGKKHSRSFLTSPDINYAYIV